MADLEVRRVRPAEVDAILDLLAPWQSRAFFERYFHLDPAFRADHVCAAFDGGRPVSCAQIVPKVVRIVGGTARVGGVGQVWTEPAYRRRGLAPQVLRLCIQVMREERFALSLMFASRFDFYSALGWHQYPRARTAVVGWPDSVPPIRVRAFEHARDFDTIRALYDAYTADAPGITVRDAPAWQGSLRAAGYPSEEFLVATDDADRPVAYMRGTREEEISTAMEYAYGPGALPAVAALLAAHRAQGASRAAFLMLDLAHDPTLHAFLCEAGFALNPVEDPFVMWRVIDQCALPLPGSPLRGTEDEIALLERVLPRARYTYWHADRF